MKDIEVNPLNKNQRRLLQLGVALILSLFLIGYFFFVNKKETEPTLKNPTVYLQDSILFAFDDTYSLAQYPDRVSLHYPYLLVIKPTQNITYIYNLEQKKKEKEVSEILLDYTNNTQLYSKGKTTYLNDQDLGILCEKGFIKSPEEVLCLAKSNVNAVQNKVVSINTTNKKSKDLYTSKGILSDIKVINGKTYMGEIDTFNHKNHILVDGKTIGVPNIVSLIYEMNEKPYFTAFKSELNQNTESYYLIEESMVVKQESGKIYLYK